MLTKRKNMSHPKHFLFKGIALTLTFSIVFQILSPTLSYALTSGPSQPEAAQFQPVGVNDMVDVFTGDFGYNIPLVELPGPNGGYPFNLSYQSGITMDQEATWVGLGWNVNPGAIVRNMRGLPDEFNGKSDAIERVVDMKKNETYGGNTSVAVEFVGGNPAIGTNSVGFSTNYKIYYNTYRGIGYGFDQGVSFSNAVGEGMKAGLGFNLSLDSQDGVGANLNATLSSEKQRNYSVYESTTTKKNLSLGIGFHSSGGLNGSISGSITKTNNYHKTYLGYNKEDELTTYRGDGMKGVKGNTVHGSSSLSFASPSHTPSIGMEMKSMNFTVQAGLGFGINGIFPHFGIGGFYSVSKIAKETEYLPAYGYLNLQNEGKDEQHAMSDFNREKDGIVYKESKNLASPSLTYDYYVINGQGIGGMYRPYRQEYGHVHEQARKSDGAGGSFGFDVGIPGKYGLNGSFNYSRSWSEDWVNDNNANANFKFRGKGYDSPSSTDQKELYEGAYFKLVGDRAAIPVNELQNIGGEEAVELKNNKHTLSSTLNGATTSNGTNANMMSRQARMPRAVSIVPYTNEQLMGKNTNGQVGTEILPEYNIQVYQISGGAAITKSKLESTTTSAYNSLGGARGKDSNGKMANGNHLAGKTIIQPDGKRYVYALPAYNNKQIDETFSVPAMNNPKTTVSVQLEGGFDKPKYHHETGGVSGSGTTDEFRERITMPKYAHSYLLTSVLGDDYVDADNIPGPSQDDYGFWVKFNYVQTSKDYKWRTPYYGATYNPGSKGSSTDDKASYSYGEKEVWYLASAETATHILYFEMSTREDGLGAAGQLYAVNMINSVLKDTKNKLYKLDRIKLYSKAELALDKDALPIQTVHFKYNYNLCHGTTNSNAENAGKLTLERIFFTYRNDRSGELSPYVFEYDEVTPDYDLINYKYDRWGTYRSFNYGNDMVNQQFPYTPQFDPAQVQSKSNKQTFKQNRDKDASAWHLKAVRLPSGGKINIEYESDDYAYVQHKKATQMVRIEGTGSGPNGSAKDNELFDDGDNFWGGDYNSGNPAKVNSSYNARRVYFKLEEPIPTSYSEQERKLILKNKYLDCIQDKQTKKYNKPLYAKFKSKLRGDIEDYISGYFYAQLENDTTPACDVDLGNTGTIDGVPCYEYAYVVLDFADINGPVHYHPFAVAAWQYLRINLPRVLTGMGSFEGAASETEHMARIASLGSWMNTIRTMFTGYRNYCFEKEMAKTIDLSESYIRLSSPDGIKYGGGSRVKKIYVQDDPIWGDDQIGQVYDYTIKESGRSNRSISSGVASYEPIIGGEENVLRSAQKYQQRIPFFTNNNLFFELPVNESYYPAPRVGYSQVTITSLNTQKVNDKIKNGDPTNTYEGIQTTGRTVHEFYTAKEFPVIATETDLDPYGKPTPIPLPFIGMIQISKLTASQGYSIKLNDMHGKPKSVKTFASKEAGGFEDQPISSVKYVYKCTPQIVDGESAYVLDSKVNVLKNDLPMVGRSATGGENAEVEEMLMGYEYDFFADFRKSVDESGTGGLAFNMEIMGGGPIQFPLPFPWPSFSFNHTSTRLAVTNKIISQSGILEEIIATDGQSTVSTKNLVFDKYTGEPLLTSVNNNYDNKIYAYQYPAYLAYGGTGSAYDNVLMEFTGKLAWVQGKGWALEKGNLQATPAVYAIGNNPGMGTSVSPLANAATSITYDRLFDLLNEGDEFIVEFLTADMVTNTYKPNGVKKWMTLYDKKLGTSEHTCSDEKNMYFYPNETDGFNTNKVQPVRMLLTRSGKRNLLNLKAGSITSLKSTNDAVEYKNSPLFQRTKQYNAGTTTAYLYDSLTSQVSRFLNQILDCNQQFPTGTYYMDSPRFLKSDGSLKYPELYGLLKSIDMYDNCGQPKCEEYETVTLDEKDWKIAFSCGSPCLKCRQPNPNDPYDQGGPCTCQISNYNMTSVVDAMKAWSQDRLNEGMTKEQVRDLWNTTTRYGTLSGYSGLSCFTAYIISTETSCKREACSDCHQQMGVLGDGSILWKGYHITLRFRDEIAGQVGQSCIIAHCLAKSRFASGTSWARTKIDHVEYISPGNLKIHYVPSFNSEDGNTSDFCFKNYSFALPSTYFSIKNVIAASAVELSPYKLNENAYAARNCVLQNGVMTEQNTPPLNLYRWGYKGIWRPYKTYYYSDERYQGSKPNSTDNMTSMLNLATDGVYDGEKSGSTYDKNFFLFNWSSYLLKKVHPKWLANETVTSFTRNSQANESKDVLGLYSAVAFDRFGYLPVATGQNMKSTEMVYENFDNTKIIAWPSGFDANGDGAAEADQCQIISVAFSGNYALSTKLDENSFIHYTFDRSKFSPEVGKKYLISVWAGGFNVLHSPTEIDAKYSHLMNVILIFKDAAGNPLQNPNGLNQLRFKPKGKIYEGKGTFWRKIEETFTIPAGTHSITIGFGGTGFSYPGNIPYGTMYNLVGNQIFIDQRACFDDLRICPADGLMNTYVYDNRNYRLIAQGDENNFPSFYGYAPSGSLTVVKKLTEEGLKTLKEIQANTKRTGTIDNSATQTGQPTGGGH